MNFVGLSDTSWIVLLGCVAAVVLYLVWNGILCMASLPDTWPSLATTGGVLLASLAVGRSAVAD